MLSELEERREQRARHQFKDTTRQAMLHADTDERERMLDVLAAVEAGAMTREDAHEAFRALQRTHQEAA